MKKCIAIVFVLICVLGLFGCATVTEENGTAILKKPPALTVVSGQTAMDALPGAYSWQVKNADGSFTEMRADSAHPLDCKDRLPPLETTEMTAALRFPEEPDSIVSVQCWRDEHWSDPAANSEAVTVNGNTMELRSGGYIYEIIAQWSTKSGYGGTAHYSIYIKTT